MRKALAVARRSMNASDTTTPEPKPTHRHAKRQCRCLFSQRKAARMLSSPLARQVCHLIATTAAYACRLTELDELYPFAG